MNQNPTTTWVSGPEEQEFANFLEFSDLQLTFPSFDVDGHDGEDMQHGSAEGVDTAMENEEGLIGYKEGQMDQSMDQDVAQLQIPMSEIDGIHGSTDLLLNLDMQTQFFHQQRQHHQQHPQMGNEHYQAQGRVPPTPNSIEMNGGHPRYYPEVDAQAQAMYDRYRRSQKEQMVFTPLVSPAVTPLDTEFRMPEYTIPGEYFSPLTSPALEAQNHAAQRSIYGNVRRSDTSDTTSPINMSIDFNTYHGNTSTPALRKSRRKNSAGTPKTPARSVKQSPAMKPQTKKKQSSSTIIPQKEVAEVIEVAQKPTANGVTRPSNGKLSLPYSQDSSEAGSISPEPLSEVLMPPPATPRPGSAGKSPYLQPKQAGSQPTTSPAMNSEPATPASLMRIQAQREKAAAGYMDSSNLKESASIAEADMERILENISLPEPATSTKPSLPPLDTAIVIDDQATTTLSAMQSLPAAPASAPITTTSTMFPSPLPAATPSPVGTVPSRKPDPKSTGKGSKKRNSTSSSQVSPGLRPRISPSIKPLLPEGATVSAEISAMLLASKSNYQNILEGTHLPGVSYPEALSTNLTSKRTSHKLAEQGRRDRINNALQEIASLLPSTTAAPATARDSSAGSSGGDVSRGSGANETTNGAGSSATAHLVSGTAAQQSNSKASTVEMAIEYIKKLQRDLKEVKRKLEVAHMKLEGGIAEAEDESFNGEVVSVGEVLG